MTVTVTIIIRRMSIGNRVPINQNNEENTNLCRRRWHHLFFFVTSLCISVFTCVIIKNWTRKIFTKYNISPLGRVRLSDSELCQCVRVFSRLQVPRGKNGAIWVVDKWNKMQMNNIPYHIASSSDKKKRWTSLQFGGIHPFPTLQCNEMRRTTKRRRKNLQPTGIMQ